MCRQSLPMALSVPSAKLMIMALKEYGYQSRREIRWPEWDPFRTRFRYYRVYGRGLPSVGGLRKRLVPSPCSSYYIRDVASVALGLVFGPLICLVGPRAHCDNTTQAQRPDLGSLVPLPSVVRGHFASPQIFLNWAAWDAEFKQIGMPSLTDGINVESNLRGPFGLSKFGVRDYQGCLVQHAPSWVALRTLLRIKKNNGNSPRFFKSVTIPNSDVRMSMAGMKYLRGELKRESVVRSICVPSCKRASPFILLEPYPTTRVNGALSLESEEEAVDQVLLHQSADADTSGPKHIHPSSSKIGD
ncbi:hypothetical protein Tco_0801728 [Tanacetum coccineum]|uniref:Uncharacterized protein n=1 Tax=Tanacetum coccineum TaxID=301880 RepID=A0ABQ4ZXP9_9ASTR